MFSQGLRSLDSGASEDEITTHNLATKWKQCLVSHRRKECSSANIDVLGLRQVTVVRPSLEELINAKETLRKSPSNGQLI